MSPPLARTSTTVFATFAEYKAAQSGIVFDGPRYGRSGTSTTFELQHAMAEIAGTETALAASSGLAAITSVLTAFAVPGAHLLVSSGVYGPTRVVCDEVLTPAGVRVEYFGPADDIAPLLRTNTCLVFAEVPSSLTMEMYDIHAIAAAAHARGVLVACDSTWGTPVFFDAHGLGVDISIHAATKFINGHSDLMLGVITGTFHVLSPVREMCNRNGTHAAPDSCWLALRGLRILAVRMQRRQESAMSVAEHLAEHDGVHRVLFPALPADPGHDLWRRQFTGAAGPIHHRTAAVHRTTVRCLHRRSGTVQPRHQLGWL